MVAHDYDMDFGIYGTLEDMERLYHHLAIELKSYNSNYGANYR